MIKGDTMRIVRTNCDDIRAFAIKDCRPEYGFIWGRSPLSDSKRPDMIIFCQLLAEVSNNVSYVKIKYPQFLNDGMIYIIHGGKFVQGVDES